MFNLDWNELKGNTDNSIFKKNDFGDSRFWKLSRGEDDKGGAIIRLLPDKNGVPLIKMFEHSVKIFNKQSGKPRYFIEDSPSTIGLPCPVTEHYFDIAKSSGLEGEDLKAAQRPFSRKVSFIANIMVVNDPANPQNNGKVFLWKFGTKLLSKFTAVLEPSDTDVALGVQPVQLFHPLQGANIFLKIKKEASGFFTYDDTIIQQPSAICEESELNSLLEKTHELGEFLKPEHYKSYTELSEKLDYVRGIEKESGDTDNTSSTANGASAFGTMDVSNMTSAPAAPVQEVPVTPTPAPVTQEVPVAPVTQEVPVTPAPAPQKPTPSAAADLDFLSDL